MHEDAEGEKQSWQRQVQVQKPLGVTEHVFLVQKVAQWFIAVCSLTMIGAQTER